VPTVAGDFTRLPVQAAPYGVPASVVFYGHNPGETYASASKIKTLAVHPVHPWVVTADEVSDRA
jgi:hypothetical protein